MKGRSVNVQQASRSERDQSSDLEIYLKTIEVGLVRNPTPRPPQNRMAAFQKKNKKTSSSKHQQSTT